MNKIAFLTLVLVTGLSFGHDEGHGPKLTDTPKQGGKVAPVIAASDVAMGTKAQLIYKSELVRSDDDQVKMFLYDKDMNILPEAKLSQFGKAAMATVEHVKKGKVAKTTKFSLSLKNGIFEGKLDEKPKTQTFNVDVKLKEGEKELLAAFDGLETRAQ